MCTVKFLPTPPPPQAYRGTVEAAGELPNLPSPMHVYGPKLGMGGGS